MIRSQRPLRHTESRKAERNYDPHSQEQNQAPVETSEVLKTTEVKSLASHPIVRCLLGFVMVAATFEFRMRVERMVSENRYN